MALERKDIKEGQLVYDSHNGGYYYLIDVDNAIKNGDRDKTSDPQELSYAIEDVVTGEIHGGICEHSGYNDALEVVGKAEATLALEIIEGEVIQKIGKWKKKLAKVQLAINRLEKNEIETVINKFQKNDDLR